MVVKNIKRKDRSCVGHGIIHIHSTFNNTIVTLTDEVGNTLGWASAGSVGFKGSRRSTSYAAQSAAEDLSKKFGQLGLRSVDIILKGAGEGRDSSIRGILSSGLQISSIYDRTPIPHNGCRPRKKRRV